MTVVAHALEVRGLGKAYRLGMGRAVHDTLRDTLTSLLRRQARASREMTWALRDATFDVPRGEVLGIIGRNGAGKTTLLKLLARITRPTEGHADVYGRVGSLLEVGTGFHPELTGRENIVLNGAILGMTRREITARTPEIVAFSGVERFLDTPVKRYSSGMLLRLAFAVASHLDTEVLFVDEVLAVGDLEFQRRCLQRLHAVTESDRTVLFVSHDLEAVRRLTTRCLLLEGGRLTASGPTREVVDRYVSSLSLGDRGGEVPLPAAAREVFDHVRVRVRQGGSEAGEVVSAREEMLFDVEYGLRGPVRGLLLGLQVEAASGAVLCRTYDGAETVSEERAAGRYTSTCSVPAGFLGEGRYTFRVLLGLHKERWLSRGDGRIVLDVMNPKSVDVDEAALVQFPGTWTVTARERGGGA